MEWNPTDTVTIGSLLAGIIAVLIFMLRNMGQRTDPALIQLLNKNMDSTNKSVATFDRLDASMDKLAVTLDNLAINIGNVFTEIIKQINDDRQSNLREHNKIADKLALIHNEKQESHQLLLGGIDKANEKLGQVESGMGAMVSIMGDIKDDTITNGDELAQSVREVLQAVNNLAEEVRAWGVENRQKEKEMLGKIEAQGEQITKIEKRITQETSQATVTESKSQTYTPKKSPNVITSEQKSIGNTTQPIQPPIEKDKSNDEPN